MATTDTRSGFRLPWSSDRNRDDAQLEPAADAVEERATGSAGPPTDAAVMAQANGTGAADGVEPLPDTPVGSATDQVDPSPDPDEQLPSSPHTFEEPQAMADPVSAPAPARAQPPRKPSKLLADLAAAMRATAETAREQALAQVGADSQQVVESIRVHSTDGTAELRQRSDADIAGIRDWSKSEIARIREQAEQRISDRKANLEQEIAAYAEAVDRRIEEVQRVVAAYEADMADFFERLLGEGDPARLATMAETMPEPPTLEPLADLATLETGAIAPAEPEPSGVSGPDAIVEAGPAGQAAGEAAEAVETAEAAGPGVEPGAAIEPEPAEVTADAVAESDGAPEAESDGAPEAESDPWSIRDSGWSTPAADPWGARDNGWDPAPSGVIEDADQAAAGDLSSPEAPALPTWVNELPEGVAAVDPSGEPIDREAIMAALEAAAEALVAAEASEAGNAMTAEDDDQFGAEAAAALAARMDAASFERDASFVERMSHLLPGRGGIPDAETVTTRVLVTGLVSVASIASFKRHLGRLAGVQAVTVSSGPAGEFVFNVTHLPELAFQDVIPTLPGFAARVTATADGVVNVTARDPETEG